MSSPAVDINNLDLLNEVIEVDGNVDAEQFFNPPLADDGEHEVTLNMGNRGVKAERQWEGEGKTRKRSGAGFLNIHLQLKGVKDNGEEGGTVAFDQLTTIPMDTNVGRTTRAHVVFDLAGFPLAEKSLGGLMQEIQLAVAQKPHVKATTRWEAQVNSGTKDSPKYETVVQGQKNFPPLLDKDGNDTGRFNPEVTDPKSGQVVRAQVRVVKYGRV